MEKTFTAVAAGRAYTDIVAGVTPEFLGRFDLALNDDREAAIDEIRAIQGQLQNAGAFAGGASANSMAMIAALGGKAGYFGKVSDDEAGNFFLDDFKKRGVTMCCDPYDKTVGLSPTCLVLTTQADRAFAYNRGCADSFQPHDFDNFDFTSSTFFFTEAFMVASALCGTVIERAFARARSQETGIAFGLQSQTTWQDHKPTLDTIMRFANIIFGNCDEIDAFRNRVKTPLPPHLTIVTTDGANGATVENKGEKIHIDAVPPAKLVNTNGAGDALAAGFLMGQSRGFSLRSSLRLGILAASAVLEETGGRPTRSLAHLPGSCE